MENEYIEDIFASLGKVNIKRLFSGKGIYYEGLIVGAVMDDEILLKTDAESAALFKEAGATQWTYTYPATGKMAGRKISMPYWTIPEEAIDDPNLLAKWTQLALEAATRSSNKHKKKGT